MGRGSYSSSGWRALHAIDVLESALPFERHFAQVDAVELSGDRIVSPSANHDLTRLGDDRFEPAGDIDGITDHGEVLAAG